MELLEAFLRADLPKATLVFVGSGELEGALKEKASHGDFSHGLKGLNTDGVRAAAPTGLGGNARAVGPTALAAGPSEEVTEHGNHSRVFETAEGKLARMTEDKFSSGDPAGKSSSHQKTENCALNTANCGHRVLFVPFQNQSAMPVVYRLGDALVLPSGYGETWGLAVNEAQACGRPSLVSDCVGCARDIIRERENGMIFRTDDWDDCVRVMGDMVGIDWRSKREAIQAGAWEFDTARGVDALLAGLSKL
jgi:glycosyltransferase involved in cell wall biosynthesis